MGHYVSWLSSHAGYRTRSYYMQKRTDRKHGEGMTIQMQDSYEHTIGGWRSARPGVDDQYLVEATTGQLNQNIERNNYKVIDGTGHIEVVERTNDYFKPEVLCLASFRVSMSPLQHFEYERRNAIQALNAHGGKDYDWQPGKLDDSYMRERLVLLELAIKQYRDAEAALQQIREEEQ